VCRFVMIQVCLAWHEVIIIMDATCLS